MSRISRRVPEVLRRPEQGWSSLLLLLGLLTVVGISLTDSRMIDIGGQDRTESLLVVLLAGGLIGFLLARSSIGVVRAHLIGAAAAAFVLLMIVAAAVQQSGTLLPAGWAELQLWVSALGEKLDTGIAAFVDDGTAQPPPEATFLVLGAICWTTAQFSAFSIFRYGRGGPAVMATGVMLFLNVALQALEPAPDLLPVWPMLAIFSALAMLLLMRMQLTQQGYQWARRHIADTGEVSRLFLRTGTLFVALTVLGASSMTLVAMAPPQEVDVGDLDDALDRVGDEIGRWLLPFIGVPAAGPGQATVGDRVEIADKWEPSEGVAFRAEVTEGELLGNYWWISAHDKFYGGGWESTVIGNQDFDAGDPLEIGADISGQGRREVEALVTFDSPPWPGNVVSPAEALEIDEPVTAEFIDRAGGLGTLVFQDTRADTEKYRIRASVQDYSFDVSGLTAGALREAGDEYPESPGWKDRYLQGAGGDEASGLETRKLARKLSEGRDNAYDKAIAVQDYLALELDYSVNIRGLCGDLNSPECLLTIREGFCQQFASTMVMVLREMDIPARFITGYLPGDDKGGDGLSEVEGAALHNWVEVYFPGFGWIRFDPTPRTEGYDQARTAFQDQESVVPVGPEVPPSFPPFDDTTSPEPTAAPPEQTDRRDRDRDDGALGAFLIGGGIAGLLLLTTFGLLFVRLRRLPKGEGGLAFRGIVSLATRLGYGPHPSQTEYEYASSLSETIPSVRDDLYLVADARVESAYGQREIGAERQVGLRRAYARIRTALLRLSLRLRR
jgi:transglutaminase-like putative cysteine protease